MSQAKGLTLVAVGQSLIREDLATYSHPAFDAVLDLVRQGEVAFTNLEGTIAGPHGGWPVKDGYCHAAPASVLTALKKMGFNTLSLSNNHSFDLGPGGILSTMEACDEHGFLHSGIGLDKTSAAKAATHAFPFGRIGLLAMDAGPQPETSYARDAASGIRARPGCNRLGARRIIEVSAQDMQYLKDLSNRTGYEAQKRQNARAGYQEPDGSDLEFYGNVFRTAAAPQERRELDPADLKRQLDAIREGAAKTDYLFVYVHHHHWENNWEATPDWMVDFAHQCIDAGAAGFISHGIPLLQGIEIYKARPIFYSLGNFIYHTHYPEARAGDDRIWQSVVATCRYTPDKMLESIALAPIVLGGEAALIGKDANARKAPHLAQPAYGETEVLARLARLSKPMGTTLTIKDGRGTIAVA